MSETPKKPLPLNLPKSDPTLQQANRLMCADYLRAIARLIDQGAITSLDLLWTHEQRKPKGKFVIDASFITAPVEADFLRTFQEIQAEPKKPVQGEMVEDLTEDFKDHKPCEGAAKKACFMCCVDTDKLS